jgi:serine/threonine-protein kinase
LLVIVLALWGLADQRDPAERTASGAADNVPSAAPSDGARSTPSVSGEGSATLPNVPGASGHPALGANGPTASLGPSAAAPTASSSGGGPKPSGDPSSLAPSGPVGTRLTSAGGVVYAVCSQGKGQLTSWEPNPGYSVQKVNQGPALAPEVVFKGATNRYRMTVTCVAGMPTPVVLPL